MFTERNVRNGARFFDGEYSDLLTSSLRFSIALAVTHIYGHFIFGGSGSQNAAFTTVIFNDDYRLYTPLFACLINAKVQHV